MGYPEMVSGALREAGVALSLLQEAAGTFSVTTQTHSAGAVTTTSTFGVVQLVQAGIDGVSVKRGDLEVWLPKLDLDVASITPVVGNYLIYGTTKLVLLEVEKGEVAGYYRCRARSAE